MLKPCGSTSNCVCTRDLRPKFHMEPLPYHGDDEAALNAAIAALKTQGEIELIERQPGYVHLAAITRGLRFRDDVEFAIDADAKLLHFRSASRLGFYDFGVNRRRMQRVRASLEQLWA